MNRCGEDGGCIAEVLVRRVEAGEWRLESGGWLLCLHSNLEVLDEACLSLFGSNDDGLVGDVGQGDLVLAAVVLGCRLTHHKDEQLCLEEEEEGLGGE